MSDTRRLALRAITGLALALAGLVEVQGLVHTLGGQSRLRDRVLVGARHSLAAALPRLAATIRPGDPAALATTVREAQGLVLGAEVEVFDPATARRLHPAEPATASLLHWPSPEEVQRIRAGEVVAFGPFLPEASRTFTYAALPAGAGVVLLRVAVDAPELLADLRERQKLLAGHAFSLALLLVAGVLALFPNGAPVLREASPRALGAYEAAMEQLHERSQRDHAELRRIEDELRDTAALARSGELAAGIAHEVRNGLGTILGYARLVERGAEPDAASNAARAIRDECETLEGVVRRFIDFVRDETLTRVRFDLARLLSRVVARETRGRPGVEVRLETGSAGEIEADEELLERAFENLVRNALEAAGEGGHVSVEARRQEESAVVSVSDDGPGLPREVREKPRPFFSTKPGGLGLGLPLAMKIVRLHGGELTLEERSPRGLRVHVRLPAAAAPAISVTERSD